ncbi:hypothetical protein M422DRAFT_28068 [Sphaerobolus stellatus SS14]|nr:hypothetical protein M422DRAFT_28068 [Sphaerobolus stellatus SS14]
MSQMSPHETIHVLISVAALESYIVPSLIHSPGVEPQDYMDPYRDPVTDSPQSLDFPTSPIASGFTTQDLTTQTTPQSVTSPSGMLVVHSYGPPRAPPGTPLTAQVDFTNLSGANVRLRIVFGDLALPTSVTPNIPTTERVRGQERGDWTLKVAIPQPGQAAAHTAANMGMTDGRLQWPLTLQALDAVGTLLDSVSFGLFSYDNYSMSSQSPTSSIYEYRSRSRSPGKRLQEDDADYSPQSYNKRISMDTDFLGLRRMSVASDSQAYAGSSQMPTNHRYFQPSTLAPSQSHYSGPSISPQAFQQVPSTQSSFQRRSPGRSDLYTVISNTSTHLDEPPALIRTSQLGHDTKSEQANISLQDDLESMKRSWSETEQKCGRRLVQFWKRQIGNILQISFAPIPQNAYKENTIVVSCIYRENVDDYFITSVDVIYLLEALAGTRFEVEEKNRIRRNLEGFKPLTISKGKSGTEDFFRIIMEFPPPRPRNIEKDVKVFEWGKLKMMLEKVFSKYSTVSPSNLSAKHEPISQRSQSMYTYPQVSTRSRIPSDPVPPYADVRPKLEEQPVSLNQHPAYQNSDQLSFADGLLSSKYSDYGDSHTGQLGSGGSYYSGMRLYDMPGEFEQPLMKGDDHTVHAAPQTSMDRHSFQADSPGSSDNSPLSMTLSISSGGSSDGQDAADASNASSFASL